VAVGKFFVCHFEQKQEIFANYTHDTLGDTTTIKPLCTRFKNAMYSSIWSGRAKRMKMGTSV
jgi:hypothetical protein